MIDFHSHILPGIDDGSASAEMSLEMLRREKAQGVDAVVATPHFYANIHTPEEFLEKRQAAVERLQEAAAGETGLPEMYLGAEVAYFGGMSEAEDLWNLRIADTNYLLVELPMPPWNNKIYLELSNLLHKQNLIPIVAHVDRYLIPFQRRRILNRLMQLPVLLQFNAGFFLHKQTRKLALRLVQEGCVHLLGTDCHNLSSRSPNMKNAVAVIGEALGAKALDDIRNEEQEILHEEIRNHCTIGANI